MKQTLPILLGFLAATSAWASPPTPEGVPPFAVGMFLERGARPQALVRLRLQVSGDYPEGTSGAVTLEFSEGIQTAVSSRRIEISQWDEPQGLTLPLRFAHAGSYTIRAHFRATSSKETVDEADYELPVEVNASAIVPGYPVNRRAERVVASSRYRYAGDYLVPIDGPENFSQSDLMQRGVKAEAVSRMAANCINCGPDIPAETQFVVFLGADGAVREMRPLTRGLSPEAEKAAREAIARWRFQPTRLAGVGVPDYLVIRVGMNRNR